MSMLRFGATLLHLEDRGRGHRIGLKGQGQTTPWQIPIRLRPIWRRLACIPYGFAREAILPAPGKTPWPQSNKQGYPNRAPPRPWLLRTHAHGQRQRPPVPVKRPRHDANSTHTYETPSLGQLPPRRNGSPALVLLASVSPCQAEPVTQSG